MTSIALTNANNCQNQGKGCSTLTPTRLIGIFQRAFEKQVKKKRKESQKQKRHFHTEIPLWMRERERERKKKEKKERSAEEQSAIVSIWSGALDNSEFAL